MKSLLILSLFAIIGFTSGATFYTLPTVAQWNAYRTAAINAGMTERSVNLTSITLQRRFAVTIPFAPDDCRLGASNSAVATSFTSSFTSGSGCSVFAWNDVRLSCYAVAHIKCGTITQFTTQLNTNTVLRQYGKSVYHHFNAPSTEEGRRQFAKRSAAKRVDDPYDIFPPDDPFFEKNNTEQNAQLGYNVPVGNGKWWHYSALTQNNKPFDLTSSPAGHRYPIYKGNGKLYTIGAGLDTWHPEFTGTRPVTVDQQFIGWPFDITNSANTALYQSIGTGDHLGHDTATTALAAGKTLGVLPKAEIYMYQIELFWGGCFDESVPEEQLVGLCDETFQPDAWVNAVSHAGTDNENRRLSGAGAGVFWSSYLHLYDKCSAPGECQECMAGDCTRSLIDVIRNAISRGLIFVNAAGNQGAYLSVDGAMDRNFYVQMFEISEIVWVGGYDISFQQGRYAKLGWDDTEYINDDLGNNKQTASNYGKEVDFWAPSKDFPYFAATSRRPGPLARPDSIFAIPGTPNVDYVPYQQWSFAQGTSFSAPLVAAGLLGYASQLPSTLSGREFVERALDAADKWAGRADLGTYVNNQWQTASNPDKIVRMFRLIPTDNSADCAN